MLVNVGWRGRWKTQLILWTERPTHVVMEAGSLWPATSKLVSPNMAY
jgi:hypothetical protein